MISLVLEAFKIQAYRSINIVIRNEPLVSTLAALYTNMSTLEFIFTFV